jgi:hypothetical protein
MDAPQGGRYRHEGDTLCIELFLRTSRQLFDSRDPAPFRERDLDPEAMEYLLDALEELPAKAPLKLVFHFAEAPEAGMDAEGISASVKAHLEHEETQARRRLGRFLRQAQLATVLAVLVLVGCLFLSGWLHRRMAPGDLREVVREGLVILGWVALWRPFESFLYDWVPYRAKWRALHRLLAAPVDVRFA